MHSKTEVLVEALRALSRSIDSPDGVANAAIAEAAERLAELEAKCARIEAVLRNRHAPGKN